MGLDTLFYRFAYRFGKPGWDTEEPRPELEEIIRDRQPGRALDLGCGPGRDAIALGAHGWEVVGVDFAPEAIAKARERAGKAGMAATFVVGDVTRLGEIGVLGPFDLLVDVGCYHTIPVERRDAYAAEVAAVARPGADLYLAGVSDPPATWRLLGAKGLSPADVRGRFGAHFALVDQRAAAPMGRASTFVLYHLVRKGNQVAD